MVGTRCRASGGAAAPPYQSIDEDENGYVLSRFNDLLKLRIVRVWRLKPGRIRSSSVIQSPEQATVPAIFFGASGKIPI